MASRFISWCFVRNIPPPDGWKAQFGWLFADQIGVYRLVSIAKAWSAR